MISGLFYVVIFVGMMNSLLVLLGIGAASALKMATLPQHTVARASSPVMIVWPGRPAKSRLLAMDDCLIAAKNPYEADECALPPAAKQELVEETDLKQFVPFAAAAVLVLAALMFMPVNPDAGVGELGTPQVVTARDTAFIDPFTPAGPPAF